MQPNRSEIEADLRERLAVAERRIRELEATMNVTREYHCDNCKNEYTITCDDDISDDADLCPFCGDDLTEQGWDDGDDNDDE